MAAPERGWSANDVHSEPRQLSDLQIGMALFESCRQERMEAGIFDRVHALGISANVS